jgi:predicted transcriptional regulator
MLEKDPSSQAIPCSPQLYEAVTDKGNLYTYDPAAAARTVLARTLDQIDSVNKIRRREVGKLSFLIQELQYLQPIGISDLSDSLGQSLNTTRTQLRKLERLDLVIKTSFEHHTLYCLNGNFNLFISQILSSLINWE